MSNYKNIAVSVLRNIVSSVFSVKPQEVWLMENTIAPNWKGQDLNSSGGMWDEKNTCKIWGFHPQTGFVELPLYMGYDYRGDWEPSNYNEGHELHSVEGVEKYIFFLVNNKGNYSCPSNGVHESWDKWELYKAPNFQKYWSKIEQEDVARWEQWVA